MSPWLRVLCCWVLALALPLQALAAGVMGVHGAAPGAAAGGLQGATVGKADERIPSAWSPCHGAGHAASADLPASGHGPGPDQARVRAGDAAPEPSAEGAADMGSSTGSAGCLHCALCAHAATSLPAASPRSPGQAPADRPVAIGRSVPPMAFLTPGIERPPR